MGERVFLSGFMAVGKSAVGRALAERLDLPFRDLDEMVETRSGRSIGEIFAADGEAAFRRLESASLIEVCGLDAVVVALGGGTVTREENRRLLRRSGRVVWLNAARSTILARLESGAADRPLFRDRQQATELLAARRDDYADCDLEIRPHRGENPAEIAGRIARRLG